MATREPRAARIQVVIRVALVLGGGRHYNFAPLFARISPYLRRADVALCHAETPMTPAPPSSYPILNTPPELATAIHQTGWRACSTASNHSLDQGQRGIDDTIRALNRAKVLHTGTYASAAARRTPLIMTVRGIRVAFLAYTDGRRGCGDRQFQLTLARRLSRSPDITAIIGQHVHVVQPIRFIGGTAVVFGEGNLISDQTSACCPAATEDRMIVLLTITVDSHGARVTFIVYVPIWVRHPYFLVLPAGTAWRTDHVHAAALRASYVRTVAVAGRAPRIQPIPAHL